MHNFEKETDTIHSHVGQSLLGHPHESRQPQPQGPQQEIDILTNINFLSILHVQFCLSLLEHPHEP